MMIINFIKFETAVKNEVNILIIDFIFIVWSFIFV